MRIARLEEVLKDNQKIIHELLGCAKNMTKVFGEIEGMVEELERCEHPGFISMKTSFFSIITQLYSSISALDISNNKIAEAEDELIQSMRW